MEKIQEIESSMKENSISLCPISKSFMRPVFKANILGKYLVTYYYCEETGILQTEEPYWLEEAYRSAIADTEYGYNAKKYFQ